MVPNSVHITIDLGALLGELQQSLQITINHVAVALMARAPESIDELRLPAEVFATHFAPKVRWSQDEATQLHITWAISNGLRDAVEGVSSFLESAHRVLSLWGLVSEAGTEIPYGDYLQAMEGTAFHRLGLPDKLEHMSKDHGITVDSNLVRHLLSINNARNCLVHRQGIVTRRDINETNRMLVEWRKLHIIIEDEDGEHDLVIGKIVEKPSSVCLRIRDEQKSFALGERVRFNAQEFADVTWGLHAFGSDLVEKLTAANPARRAGEAKRIPPA